MTLRARHVRCCVSAVPFPNAERYYDEAISLPMFPALTDGDVEQVIGIVRSAVEELAAGVSA